MYKSTLTITICLIASVISLGGCTATSKTSKKAKKTIQKSQKAAKKQRKNKDKRVLSKEKAAYISKYGVPQISFVDTKRGLCVNIKTKHLELTSVSMEDFDNYYKHLFSDPKAMKKYAEGKPRSKRGTKKLLTMWVKRWKSKNPFSGLVVRRKAEKGKKKGAFVGHIVLGLSPEKPNDAALAGLMKPTEWNNQYGYEAAGAVVLFYAPELAKRGYKLPRRASFQRIVASARPDNKVSTKILKSLGFTVYDQGKPYSDGVKRKYYAINVNALQ